MPKGFWPKRFWPKQFWPKQFRPKPFRPMILALGLAVAGGAVVPAAAQPDVQPLAAPRWAVLAEAGMAVDYPANIFSVDAGPSTRGTGRRLQTADGRADFMLFVMPNPDRDNPRRFVRKHLSLPRAKLD